MLARAQKIINLTLHGVGGPARLLPVAEASVWLTEDKLQAILYGLQQFNNFTLTVDDGGQSDIEIIMPALLRNGIRAIFFIPAGRLGQPGYLRQGDVQSLAREGMEIGTHGMYHRNWRMLNDYELNIEIYESKKILEDITGQPILKVSCPFGSYDRRVLRHLRKARFQIVYTSDRGPARSNWWLQPRNTLHSSDTACTLRAIKAQPSFTLENIVRRAKGLVKRWR